MSRRDNIHDTFRKALESEGWTITHDPLPVKIGNKSAQIDLGAERIIAAEKENEFIAIEVKSFIGTSTITEFYRAIGQWELYGRAMKKQYPGRTLFLGLPKMIYKELYQDIFEFEDFEDLNHQIVILDIDKNSLKWIK